MSVTQRICRVPRLTLAGGGGLTGEGCQQLGAGRGGEGHTVGPASTDVGEWPPGTAPGLRLVALPCPARGEQQGVRGPHRHPQVGSQAVGCPGHMRGATWPAPWSWVSYPSRHPRVRQGLPAPGSRPRWLRLSSDFLVLDGAWFGAVASQTSLRTLWKLSTAEKLAACLACGGGRREGSLGCRPPLCPFI